jgi:quercetin dioxygenase-like cupin family protein
MTESEFQRQLATHGYDEMRTLSYEPDQRPPLHHHEFSAMGMVTDGELTIVQEEASHTYRPGEWYEVPAGTTHAEHSGPTGATAVLGTKPAD